MLDVNVKFEDLLVCASDTEPFYINTICPPFLYRNFFPLTKAECNFLYSVAIRASKGILEINTAIQGTSFLLAFAQPTLPIYNTGQQNLIYNILNKYKFNNISLTLDDNINNIDLIYCHGINSYDYVYSNLVKYWELLPSGGELFVSNCNPHHYPEVASALVDFLSNKQYNLRVSPSYIGQSFDYIGPQWCCLIAKK